MRESGLRFPKIPQQEPCEQEALQLDELEKIEQELQAEIARLRSNGGDAPEGAGGTAGKVKPAGLKTVSRGSRPQSAARRKQQRARARNLAGPSVM